MDINYLFFNGRRSDEFGIMISGDGTFNAPERSFTKFEIPGRNGELTIDNGYFQNVTISYTASIAREFHKNSCAIREWLLSASGYQRLEDTYDPEHFRMARFAGGVEFGDMTQLCRGATLALTFDCNPQRFLKSGEEMITIAFSSSGETVKAINPTPFDALPIIRIMSKNDDVAIRIGDVEITTTKLWRPDSADLLASGILTIDCERMDAYANGENFNKYVTLTDFPRLKGGTETTIEAITEGVTLNVIPRWWTI